jgi:UbiD family decarboxylase
VPSETLGDGFLVPADADVVIEGYVPKGARKPEGPFGEFTRHVGPQRWGPMMKVTAVTRRQHAYWDDVMVGHTHWISSLTKEGEIFGAVRRAVPGVKAVHVPMSGTGALTAYVQIKKTVEGQGKVAGVAALAEFYTMKHAFVFDEDVDIFSDKDVLLAMATRFQAEKGLVVLPSVTGSPLDPSAHDDNTCSKAVFDCTKPLGQPFAERLAIPADVEARVAVEGFVRSEQLTRIPVEPWG